MRTLTLLLAEGIFFATWAIARLGVALMPKGHPLKQYHGYSKERIRSIYIESARTERRALRG